MSWGNKQHSSRLVEVESYFQVSTVMIIVFILSDHRFGCFKTQNLTLNPGWNKRFKCQVESAEIRIWHAAKARTNHSSLFIFSTLS